MPPKVAAHCPAAAATAASSRTSTASGSARPPARSISAAAVWMVPGNFGCGCVVLAAMAMLAPSRAARSAIALPIPRLAPVMNRVFPRKLATVPLGDKELRAVLGLGVIANFFAARDALARRQRTVMLDVVDQPVECLLGVRLDQLELRVERFVAFDVITVLHLVEAVFAVSMVMRGDLGGVCARVPINRQQPVHRPGDGDQRPSNAPCVLESGDLLGDVGLLAALGVVVVTGAGTVGVIGGIQALLPLALRHFPEAQVVALPERERLGNDVRRIAGSEDVLGGGAVGVVPR